MELVLNNGFVELSDSEMYISDGEAGAYTVGTLSAAVFGTVTGTASLVATGALVASGVGLGLVAVGLAGCAVYSFFN